MIEIIAIILFIYLIFANRSISARLRAVEFKIKNNTSNIDNVGIVEVEKKPEQVNTNIETPVTNVNVVADVPNKFTTWLKEDWLMKLGGFLFIVGFGWFVSYAFANNWIGPVGRISIGIVGGALVMILGYWRMIKYPSQGAVFMALGAGMAMLTIFAGRSVYGFFTPTSAIFFDFIIAAFVSFASYKFNVKSLALIAQILAFVSPILTAGRTDAKFLFTYLLVFSVATLVLASFTGWRHLISTSLLFVGLYSLPYFGGYGINTDASVILNFAYVFSALYLLSGMFAVIKKGVEDFKNEIVLAVLNGFFLFLWIYNVVPREWTVLVFAVWAIIFVISSFAAFKFSSELSPFYAYGSVAVAFIGAATAAQLHGASLVIAFTIEVLLLVVIVFSLTKNIRATIATAWLFLIPMLLSFNSITQYASSKDLFSKDFFVLILLALALIVAGRVITHFGKQDVIENEVGFGSVLVVLGVIYLGYILWEFIHIFMVGASDMATMTTLVIYTIFGIIGYFSGLYGKDMARKTYGIALLAFVVVRLIFVDVWDMALFGRVITFLAIGVLLMSTAFLTKKNKQNNV